MIEILTILQYFIQSVVDVGDKFLISKRKIEPVSYTFFTVVMGALLLVAWPFVYSYLPAKFIVLNLLSGSLFSLAMFIFFKALAEGEVSRVVPFVFGLVPVFDLVIGKIIGRNILTIQEVSAVCLLVPGAMLISYKKNEFSHKHLILKVLSAVLFSSYYAFWQYGAQVGPVLNNLIWNRLGAALVLCLFLLYPSYRKKVFRYNHVEKKQQTTLLFLGKQLLGGLNFIFFSELLIVGKIAIINALQGFRYLFLFIFSFILSKKNSKILDEHTDSYTIRLKFLALGFIFFGTVILFWR